MSASSPIDHEMSINGPRNRRRPTRATSFANGTQADDELPSLSALEMTPEEESFRISFSFFVASLLDHINDNRLITELVVYLPFVIIFSVVSLLSIQTEETHMAVGGLAKYTNAHMLPFTRDDNASLWYQLNTLADGDPAVAASFATLPDDVRFNEIGNINHLALYINLIAYQLFGCAGGHDRNSTLLPRTFLGQVSPVGALRLRTQQVRNDSCVVTGVVQGVDPETLQPASKTCYGGTEDITQNRCVPPVHPLNASRRLWSYHSCNDFPGASTTTTEFGVYHCGGNIIDIPFGTTTCPQAESIMRSLQTYAPCPFVDVAATRFFIAEFIMYSPNLDTFLSAKHVVEISSGGGFLTSVQNRAFLIITSRQVVVLVLDFFFLAMILYYIVKFFLDWRSYYKENGRVLSYLLNLWTLVELFNAITYLAMFVLRFMWWANSSSVSKDLAFNQFPVHYDSLLTVFSQMRYALTFNFLLTFLKLIKFLKVSDRLSIISLTFEKAQADVLGLLFLFVVVVVGYAITGNALFGTVLPEYASLDRSLSALMFILLGVMDYNGMKIVSPVLSGLFFWSFLIICFFLLLNFICAVISNAFSAAQNDKFVMPLSDSIGALGSSIFFTLRPTTVWNKIRLLRKGKSIAGVYQELLSIVETDLSQQKLRYPDRLEHYMTLQQLYDMCNSSLKRDIFYFLPFLWSSVKNEYILREDTSQLQIARERAASIAEGYDLALRGIKPKLPRIEERMRALTSMSDRAVEALFVTLENRSRQNTTVGLS
mgnify:FL=1